MPRHLERVLKYIAYKDQKAFMRDLKRVYGAESEEIAMRNLESMMDSWKKYAVVLDNWLDKWEHLSTYCMKCLCIRTIQAALRQSRDKGQHCCHLQPDTFLD